MLFGKDTLVERIEKRDGYLESNIRENKKIKETNPIENALKGGCFGIVVSMLPAFTYLFSTPQQQQDSLYLGLTLATYIGLPILGAVGGYKSK
jgi:hypothetical protein